MSLFSYLYIMSARSLLDRFNDGDENVLLMFDNNYQIFFDYLKSRGLANELDPSNLEDTYQNEFMLWLMENDSQRFLKSCEKFFNDIEVSGNTVYWVGNREDLADLFCKHGRNELSQDTVRSILGDGDDWYEPYWETTDDVYRDVIDELDEKNIEQLKKILVEDLWGKHLDPRTEEMELIASEQGHNDFWTISNENVARIIDNEESMKSLLDNELPDLKSELYSIHSDSWNSAYQSMVYDDIMNELDEIFDVKQAEWIKTKHRYKQNVEVYKYKVPITSFENILNDYLESRYNTLEYWGSFLSVAGDTLDCLSAYVHDYPNLSEVDKNINEYFRDRF